MLCPSPLWSCPGPSPILPHIMSVKFRGWNHFPGYLNSKLVIALWPHSLIAEMTGQPALCEVTWLIKGKNMTQIEVCGLMIYFSYAELSIAVDLLLHKHENTQRNLTDKTWEGNTLDLKCWFADEKLQVNSVIVYGSLWLYFVWHRNVDSSM